MSESTRTKGEIVGLNESKGNMYPFVTHTWNVFKGKCPHECSYCYMKRYGEQKPLRFDEKELKTDLGSGNFIFVGSSCDMFAEHHGWTKDEHAAWWHRAGVVLEHCNRFENSYFFQSKNPERMFSILECGYLEKPFSVCTTIETTRAIPNIWGVSCPSIHARTAGMLHFREQMPDVPRYLTIEPVMDFNVADMITLIDLIDPVQVNIGADSGGNGLPEPSGDKIQMLLEFYSGKPKFVLKKNLSRIYKVGRL